jgi:hypothetical protein
MFARTAFTALALLALLAAPALAEVTTIYDIQSGLGGFTPGIDELTVEEVVVTASGRFGFFVQEVDPRPGTGRMYAGIWVFTYGDHLGFVKRGDLVNVTGIYDEYFDFSELDVTHSNCSGDCGWEIVGTATVPDPVEVAITDINDTGLFNEAYESVLVRVDINDNELFAGEPNQYDEWQLWTDGVGVGDFLWMDAYSADPEGEFDYPLPSQGDVLEFAAGVLTYSYGSFKLAPRNCTEDLGIACPPELRGLWPTSNNTIDVLFAVDVDLASAENPNAYFFDSGLFCLSAERDAVNHRLVHLTTEEMIPGLVDIAYIEGVLSEGDLVMMPDAEFTFSQGITTIEQIQTVADLVFDDSVYLGVIVSTTGRVTAVENQYYYLQQADAGPFKHLYVRVAKTGEMAVGDSVMVAGRVDEYFGGTNLRFAPGVQYFENLGPASDPVVVTAVTVYDVVYNCDDDDESGPSDNRAEPWEWALVRLEPAALDSIPLVSQQFGEWYLLVDPDTALVDFTDDLNGFMNYPAFTPGDSIRITGILAYDYDYKIRPRSIDDVQVLYTTSVEDLPPSHPALLMQNSPNPFARNTSIVFQLPEAAGSVTIEIYDVTGARVQRLLAGQALEAGVHVVPWQGVNDAGLPMPSGNYFYRLSVDGQSRSKQMLLLK